MLDLICGLLVGLIGVWLAVDFVFKKGRSFGLVGVLVIGVLAGIQSWRIARRRREQKGLPEGGLVVSIVVTIAVLSLLTVIRALIR